jgi:hypothetical protein
MSIKIVAIKNKLSSSASPYFVHAEHSGVVEPDELAERMAAHPIAFSKADISIFLLLFAQEVAELAADGKYVKTAFGAFYLYATGSLASPRQRFRPEQEKYSHALRLGFSPNKNFEAVLRASAKIERPTRPDTAPRAP